MTVKFDKAELFRRCRGGLKTAVREGANKVFADAKAGYPVDTGALKNSGRIVEFEKPDAVGAYVKFGNERIYYAPFVELGTVKRKAVPALRNALRKNRGDIKSGFDGDLF